MLQIFMGLLCLPLDRVGFAEITIPGWRAIEGLGSGRFANVYLYEQDNKEAAAKIYETENCAMQEMEIGLLNGILRDCTNAPNIIESVEANISARKYLVTIVGPVGLSSLGLEEHAFFKPSQAVALLAVLEHVHKNEIVHRDVKPDNIYFDRNDLDRIILSDWSSAAKLGQRCGFVGTRLFADRPDDGGSHIPNAQSDLRALVKTVFCLVRQKVPLMNDWDDVERHWAAVSVAFPAFKTALEFASDCDYSSLRNYFESIH
jgi:serine/threonine protein kinase